jgi:hypothetical protein
MSQGAECESSSSISGSILRIDPRIHDVQDVEARGLDVKDRIDVGVQGAFRNDFEGTDFDGGVERERMNLVKPELSDQRGEKAIEAINEDRRLAIEQIQAFERAMIVVKVRNENCRELELADPIALETHVRKSVTVSAERIFEDGIEREARSSTFEEIARMEDARDRECRIRE